MTKAATHNPFETAFQKRTRESLRLILPLIGGLHALVAATVWFVAPYEQAIGLSASAALITVAAASATALLIRGEHTYIRADGLAACVLLLALCNSFVHLASAWSPLAVAAAALLVAVIGQSFSGRGAFAIVAAAMHAWCILLAAADNWSLQWVQFETALLAGTLTAWSCYHSRRTAAIQLFESEQQLAERAQRDALTNLPIRTAIIDRLGECFARYGRNSARAFGLCVMNLDGFRKINEQYGHTTGDLLLQTFAERLRVACRRSDMVARLGGDEFVILLDETPTCEHADAGADRLAGLCCAPVELDGVTLEFSATYGVVWAGSRFESEEAMLSAAHKEMETAKVRYHAIARALEAQRNVQGQENVAALPSMA